MRVAAGAVARRVLDGVRIRGALVQIGAQPVDRARWDWEAVDANPFFCPDPVTAALWEEQLAAVRKRGSSVGAVIEVVADGVPPGLGAPIYAKLDADIAGALMGINAVKAVEIGAGFAAAALHGEENADAMHMADGAVAFDANHAGGILGGISTGQPIVVRFAVKPTSSILVPVASVGPAWGRGGRVDPGAARPLRRHPRGAGRGGYAGLRSGRPPVAPPCAESTRCANGRPCR